MSKVAHYLQEHLVGEVMTSEDARKYFSTDGSIFTVTPAVIVYPRGENDVRKTARFSWQLAERGKIFPITARGSGSDQSGGALGQGIMLVFPAHMNKVLTLDPRKGIVAVQPGINYDKLQQTLHTHGCYLPPYPASSQFCTIGGAVANNAAGEKSVKYGATREYVDSLRVVLANGEVIETKRLNKRELNKKLGLTSFEGEVYRQLDALISDNWDTISKAHEKIKVTKNAAGYDLFDVRGRDGSFDLTPLIVGSQGTLGIVTEAHMRIDPFQPHTTLMVASFDDLKKAADATGELRHLKPSAIELVDDNLLNFIDGHNPNQLKNTISKPFPKIVLLIEFDDSAERSQRKHAKKAEKILKKYASEIKITRQIEEQELLWKIRRSAAAVLWQSVGNAKALPIIEDGIVPPEKVPEFIEASYALYEKYGLTCAVWGHAGDGHLHMQPFLDLSQLGDRQKVFKIMDEYHKTVLSLGGSISGEHNDGRLRAPYLPEQFGDEMYDLFTKVKQIFDPYNMLNPGVKINVTLERVKPLLRQSYSMEHLYDHMPRS